ncbi:MAG: DUF1236 domain-containing protein [Xanthobacteraceae bacterium]
MKKTLLATAAMAAVSLAVGLGGIAAAQSQMGNESGKGMSGTAPGAMQKGASPGGTSQGGKTMTPSGGQPAQSTERNGKQNERLGQSPSDQQKGMTRGAQEEKPGAGPKGTQEKGAQEERGMKERGAQEERGKAGVNGNERLGQSHGSGKTSVQLSQDQRTRIQAVIGKEHAPHFSGGEHFDITVGARVPRDVHVAALPEDIVTIVPEYRGFDYILVGDNILIVDPVTLEIVAVIPA